MTDICYITTCMGRLNHLRETLGTWVAQPNASCIVVDYSCPDRCGDWVEQTYPQVQVVRVTGQSRFHLTHARNVGAREAKATWLCFIDADVALTPSFADNVVPLLRPGRFYRAIPCPFELCGTVLCPRVDFARVDGYDEVFQNYGREDSDLYVRFRWIGLVLDGFPAYLVRSLPHDDDLRVRFYDVKQKTISDKINFDYGELKHEVTKLLGRSPSLDVRRQLYELVKRRVEKTLANTQQPWNLEIDFRPRDVPGGGAVEGRLRCTLIPPKELGLQTETSEIVIA